MCAHRYASDIVICGWEVDVLDKQDQRPLFAQMSQEGIQLEGSAEVILFRLRQVSVPRDVYQYVSVVKREVPTSGLALLHAPHVLGLNAVL